MALFGPKSTPVPLFADGRGPIAKPLTTELEALGWSGDTVEVLSKRFPVEGIDGSLLLFFGTWNASQYATWMQMGRTTTDGKVPYPFTRVKILPYGFTNFAMMLVLVRLFDPGVTPKALEVESAAKNMSGDMWDIRNQAQNYGPIG